MSDHYAVFHSMDTDPNRTIFIIVTHGSVFSYFVETDTFEMIPLEDGHSWLDMWDDENPWWKRIT